MKKDILVVIDMQNDFITGALGTAEAQAVLPRLAAMAESFDGEIWFTMDTHEADYMQTQEGRFLPVPHCLRGSEGWKLADRLQDISGRPGVRVFEKGTFGSTVLAQALLQLHAAGELGSVTFAGVCTDICVVSNALMVKAFLPEVPLYVAGDCCAGVTPDKHEAAIETMKSCQISVI